MSERASPIRQKIHYYPNSNPRGGIPVESISRRLKPSEYRSSITVGEPSWEPRVPAWLMARRKPALVVVGLLLLVVGGLSVYESNVSHFYQSTFNVLPGKFFKITANLRDQTLITGQFQESSGRPVGFRIMSSVQFAAFQTGQGNGSLYSLGDTATGSVSFTSSVPDAYYLLFLHGAGLQNVTQAVNFQRTYVSPDEFQLAAGIVLLVLGSVQVVWGVRPRQSHGEIDVPAPPPEPPAW